MMLMIVIWRDTQVAIRGPSAKGLDCVSGARVRIPLSPPSLPKDGQAIKTQLIWRCSSAG